MHLEWDLDFDKQVLIGTVTLDVEKVDPNATEVILDSRDLKIKDIVDAKNGQRLPSNLHPKSYAGRKLDIQLPKMDTFTR